MRERDGVKTARKGESLKSKDRESESERNCERVRGRDSKRVGVIVKERERET